MDLCDNPKDLYENPKGYNNRIIPRIYRTLLGICRKILRIYLENPKGLDKNPKDLCVNNKDL